MPKGNVVLTKTLYKKLSEGMVQEFGEDYAHRFLEKFKEITDFDEYATCYNKSNYLENREIKKKLKRDGPLYEDILRTRLRVMLRGETPGVDAEGI